jgi:hypothetical protein
MRESAKVKKGGIEMERKIKILLVLCIILLSTTAIFAYTTAVYMNSNQHPKNNPSKTFVYTWTAEEQNVTDNEVGLQINVTFTIEGSLLRVVTIINDTEIFPSSRKLLAIAFDKDNNGYIDVEIYVMFPNNTTLPALIIINGPVDSFAMSLPSKAINFYCEFDGQRYLYNATFLLDEPYYTIYGDLFQLTYQRGYDSSRYVTKVDHFGLR